MDSKTINQFFYDCEMGNIAGIQQAIALGVDPSVADNFGLLSVVIKTQVKDLRPHHWTKNSNAEHNELPVVLPLSDQEIVLDLSVNQETVDCLLQYERVQKGSGLLKVLWAALDKKCYTTAQKILPYIQRDDHLSTLVRWALIREDTKLTVLLIPFLKNTPYMQEAFKESVRNNDLVQFKILFEHRDNTLDNDVFLLACGHGAYDMVEMFLPHCNETYDLNQALTLACTGSFTDVIDLLWKRADVNNVLTVKRGLLSESQGFNYLKQLYAPIEQKNMLLNVLESHLQTIDKVLEETHRKM